MYFLIVAKGILPSINLKFSFIVLLKMNGSCLIIEIFFLSDVSVKSFILTPSNNICPSIGSNILVIKLNNVDFPCPDLPTMAIFLFGSSTRLNLLRVICSFGYPNVTSLNSIIPFVLEISFSPNFSSSYNLFSNISLTLPCDTTSF